MFTLPPPRTKARLEFPSAAPILDDDGSAAAAREDARLWGNQYIAYMGEFAVLEDSVAYMEARRDAEIEQARVDAEQRVRQVYESELASMRSRMKELTDLALDARLAKEQWLEEAERRAAAEAGT